MRVRSSNSWLSLADRGPGPNRPRAVALALALAVALAPAAFGQAPEGPDSPAGDLRDAERAISNSHGRMLSLLEGIRVRSASENTYVGTLVNRRDRELLESLAADAPAAQRARLHLAVGKDELRLGNNAKAVDHLLEAYRLSDESLVQPALQLAIAYFRLGETENCFLHPNPNRCILPIRGEGVHHDQTGARQAIRYLREVLRKQPSHLPSRWLLNLAYMSVGEYPEHVPREHLVAPEVFAPDAPFARFVDVGPELGLDVMSLSGGAIADDFDGDGWLDLLVSDWSPSAQIRYFRNSGDGRFSERTHEAGLTGILGGLNLIHADYDNDGDLDVYVLRGAWLGRAGRYPNSLLQNDGDGRFSDVTMLAGLGEGHFPTQTAAWSDYDNDGDLDLFVGNEHFPSQLFRNEGDGTFEDIAHEAGVTNGAMAKGVVWGDYDADRLPDLYVSNFGAPNRLYHNNGDGTFTDIAQEAGVALPFRSFPAWFWDFNNDGLLDLFVSSYERDVADVAADYFGLPAARTEPDSLYQGDGRGGFRDVAMKMNLTSVTQPMGSNFGDLDNDGYPDFYLGTGYPEYEGLMPNLLFLNQRGSRFADVTTAAGLGHLQKGHGVAFADFDHDGDLDLYLEIGGAYAGDVFGNALFENPGFGNQWLAIRLVGEDSNRSALGARIRAVIREDGARRSVYKWVNTGGSFGANPLRQHLGLGRAKSVELLEIYWPSSDSTQQFRNVPAGQILEVMEHSAEYRTAPHRSVRFATRGGSGARHP